MQIQATHPISDPHGGAPYDHFLVTLAASPIVDGAEVRAAVSMRLTPFRTTEDGTIQPMVGSDIPLVFGNVFQSATQDQCLCDSLAAILGAVQTYVVSRGL